MTKQDDFPPALVEAVAVAYRHDYCEKAELSKPFPAWPQDTLEGQIHWRAHALIALRAVRDFGALVPDGWVAVPREPTEPMLAVMHDKVQIMCRPDYLNASILNDRDVWGAMIAAAPKPGGV